MIDRLIDQIRRKQAEIAQSLARGSASDMNAYLKLSGHWRGLEEALEMIDVILQENEEDKGY